MDAPNDPSPTEDESSSSADSSPVVGTDTREAVHGADGPVEGMQVDEAAPSLEGSTTPAPRTDNGGTGRRGINTLLSAVKHRSRAGDIAGGGG